MACGEGGAAWKDNWDILVKLLESGAKACREVCPRAKIIIHTEKAGEWDKTKSYYNHLRQLDYDVIGLSYYPMWHKAVGVLGATLDSLAVNFPDKEVMIVETAAYYSHEKDQWAKSADQYSEFYPISTEGNVSLLTTGSRIAPSCQRDRPILVVSRRKCLRKYGDGRLAESGAF